MSDIRTVISYINNIRNIKSKQYNETAVRIHKFCIRSKLRISAAHIPGSFNLAADVQSRVLLDDTE